MITDLDGREYVGATVKFRGAAASVLLPDDPTTSDQVADAKIGLRFQRSEDACDVVVLLVGLNDARDMIYSIMGALADTGDEFAAECLAKMEAAGEIETNG